ncbi:polygalacturonase At1g48100 isoform X2 [Phalaenopsis equestris]|uniref:polygalacturonase At1g48100 isoform X2 n=1 Tax=Phalaenopsis equestris TaxID=78828 RepID=UPI0009E4A649|nr:polygalacturonase At1g48100 isoform X2 [Phalaenopsis equestris]
MMKARGCDLLLLVVLWLVISGSEGWSIGAHNHEEQEGNSSHGSQYYSSSGPSPAPYNGFFRPHGRIFSILDFGAKGDGVSDDSMALLAAWKAACTVPEATIEIPSNFIFLIKPITLQGPCKSNLVLKIDGTLLAPSNTSTWSKSTRYQWLNLKWLSSLIIQGSGTLDGQGSSWWNLTENTLKQTEHSISEMRPTILRFYQSCNLVVRDIQIINSPLCHLKFDNSRRVLVMNITISSPEDSPNTDGIHLQNSTGVEIRHSIIGCGREKKTPLQQTQMIPINFPVHFMDVFNSFFELSGDDCVSIQTGCSNIHLHHLECSPSHGISIGGLGKGNSLACVSNVYANNINIQNALSGVRIKTWQGGFGSVRNVTFSNIQVSDVQIPLVIDQYYCSKKSCKNKTDAVAISGISYKRIIGTYIYQPMSLACSDSIPCIDIDIIDIQLFPALAERHSRQALCWNSYGRAVDPLKPSSIACLHKNNRQISPYTKPNGYIC